MQGVLAAIPTDDGELYNLLGFSTVRVLYQIIIVAGLWLTTV